MSGAAIPEFVLREDRGAAAWLTLNRPDKANVLSTAMLTALYDAVCIATKDDSVRVIVLAAAGRIFCAGHDLSELRAHEDPAWQAALFARCSALMLSLARTGKPVIACVQGTAVAAGCQLVAACDLAYAAEGARFGVNGIDLGLFCATPSVALSRTVGRKPALEMLLTGGLIDAAEAVRIGLVNAAVPDAQLAGHVQAVADRIATKLPAAIGMGKALYYRQLGAAPEAAYAQAERCMVENLALPEAGAAIDGFLARRA